MSIITGWREDAGMWSSVESKKLKAILRKAADRLVDGFWRRIGKPVELFLPAALGGG